MALTFITNNQFITKIGPGLSAIMSFIPESLLSGLEKLAFAVILAAATWATQQLLNYVKKKLNGGTDGS